MILKTLLVLAGIYLLLGLAAFWFQEKLIFHPRKGAGKTPADIGLQFETVWLGSAPGVQVHGWYVPAGAADREAPVVLFCHGNAGNLTHRLETVRLIHELGYALLIFDYQGYGQSQGAPSESGTYADVEAAWDYLVRIKGMAPGRVVLWGRSLGGAVAAWCAQQHTPCALVLESTFTSLPDIGAKTYPFFPVRFFCRFAYDTRKRLDSIRCPVLVVHSPEDSIVSHAFGRRLYAAAGEPKRFLEITGDHNDGFLVSGQQYAAGVADFIRSFCPCRKE